MAILPSPESSSGIWSAIKGSLGLFADQNKAQGITENSNPTPEEEYESKLSDTEIIELTSQWRRTYSVYYTDIEKGQKLSFDYWVGKHRQTEGLSVSSQMGNVEGVTDNLIFEAIETFLPIATKANPEPLVNADPSDQGQELAKQLKVALAHEADVQQLRRKLAKATRGWLLNRIGVAKVVWNPITKQIQTEVINAKRMVFDRDGYVDERCRFKGEYIGEKKKLTAERLAEMFPKKKTEITQKAHGKMATKLEYFEWWYRDTDLFFTLDELVLGKYKNPNWNYDTPEVVPQEAGVDDETGEELLPAIEAQPSVPATNHLDEPTSPYRFLAIFSTNEQPHDNTSLILQNIPQQDKINRREKQIEDNVKGMNNGIVVSGMHFTSEQASQVASALGRGSAILVPSGNVKDAVLFPERPALPADVFKSLEDARSELRNVFGTAGSTAQGVEQQDTVRGKILVNQMDSSRIGGGITEYIEQLADAIYNLWVQFMVVYYDEPHFVISAGTQGGMELMAIKNDQFPGVSTLTVTVKEGSLVPKDPLTQRNEAIDLWSANAIDPLNLYKKLDFPDPAEATNQLILWQMLQKGQIQPQQYLPTFAAAGSTPGQPQPGTPLPTEQPGTGGPAVSPPPNQGVQNPPAGAPPEQVVGKQLLQSEPLPK